MLFNWFDAAEAKEFGSKLALFFVERMAAEAAGGKTAKPAERKRQEILMKMSDQVARFRQEHKLNIYKKAQLGNAFQWTLRDAGCEADYADQLTKWLMLRC